MHEAINSDRESLLPWLPWARTENRTPAECLATIERFRSDRERTEPPPETFGLSILDAQDGSILGGTSFHRVRHAFAEAEIGYWIRADRRGRGLCTEAVAAMLSWGFTPQPTGWGFRRIVIYCAEPNVPSRRIPERLGLRLEVRAKNDRWVEGIGFCDTLGWGILAEEWDLAARRRLTQP